MPYTRFRGTRPAWKPGLVALHVVQFSVTCWIGQCCLPRHLGASFRHGRRELGSHAAVHEWELVSLAEVQCQLGRRVGQTVRSHDGM